MLKSMFHTKEICRKFDSSREKCTCSGVNPRMVRGTVVSRSGSSS